MPAKTTKTPKKAPAAVKYEKNMDAAIKWACETLGVKTLADEGRDSLDFKEVSKADIRALVGRVFALGYEAGHLAGCDETRAEAKRRD